MLENEAKDCQRARMMAAIKLMDSRNSENQKSKKSKRRNITPKIMLLAPQPSKLHSEDEKGEEPKDKKEKEEKFGTLFS